MSHTRSELYIYANPSISADFVCNVVTKQVVCNFKLFVNYYECGSFLDFKNIIYNKLCLH